MFVISAAGPHQQRVQGRVGHWCCRPRRRLPVRWLQVPVFTAVRKRMTENVEMKLNFLTKDRQK